MVRQLIWRAMAGALCAASVAALCAATPRMAYAVDENVEKTIDVSSINERLTTIDVDMNINANKQEDKLKKIGDSLSTIETELTPKDGKSTNDYLSSIEDKLSQVAGNTSQEQLLDAPPLNRNRAGISFVCYANAPASGTYYNYASGYLQQMSYDDDYVFMQDSTSSYVLVFGKLTQIDNNTITGNNVKYCRWYYSNNSVGYLMETGQNNITISINNHVILSSIPKWPAMLSANDETLRREVGFYALVALACSVLRDVWSFLVRMRTASLSLDGKG